MGAELKDRSRWMRFAIVGGIGFLVDGSILAVAVHLLRFGPVEARLASFASAVAVTWLLNRRFTFNLSTTPDVAEFVRYLATGLLGFGINLGCYLALVLLVPIASRYPVFALVPSAGLAALFNYWGNLRYVFR